MFRVGRFYGRELKRRDGDAATSHMQVVGENYIKTMTHRNDTSLSDISVSKSRKFRFNLNLI